MTPFSAADVPEQTGRTIVVTGGNGGIGLEAARVLAARGAEVVLACRDLGKARAAADDIRRTAPRAALELRPLDLADLASVRAFAADFAGRHARLDVLVNNAGVMAIPLRRTADGFEMQLGTNHFGHFALTGLLLERLLATPGARVVTVSSGAHRMGRIDFDDPNAERSYARWRAYGQSKLANLLFALELARRLERARATLTSVACHPGWAATDLQFVGSRMDGSRLFAAASQLGNRLFAQSAAQGALPTLLAATGADAKSGDYYGPDGLGELRGAPRRVGTSAAARSETDARRLWELSERLTGVRYGALGA